MKQENIKTNQIEELIKSSDPILENNLNPIYTFNSFNRAGNELAFAAVVSVSKNPGKGLFNPVVIVSKSGLGKTHLIQAIGNEIKKNFKQSRVYYTESNTFINDFMDFLSENKINEFIGFYKSLDVLIIDDVHLLDGQDKVQNILQQILNALLNKEKLIILSSNRPLNELEKISKEVISIFSSGLVTNILPTNSEIEFDKELSA